MRKQLQFARIALPIFMSCIFTAISGCASPSQVPALEESLNAEASCCASYAEFDFPRMPTDEEFKFSIGPGDKAYRFPSGKSYFKSFRLPEFDYSHSLEVKTYPIGRWIPTGHVFAPFLTFLNEAYTPVGDLVAPELFYNEGWFEAAGWTSIVHVPSEATYVVFHTAPELFNKKISRGSTSGYAYTTSTGTVYVPSSGEQTSSYGPSGTLRVRFLPTVK